jgi:hypothetical protein
MSDITIGEREVGCGLFNYPISCGKIRYPGKAEAERALAHVLTHGNWRRKKPKRTYECPECEGWHITHLEAWNTRFQQPRAPESAGQKARRAAKADRALDQLRAMRERQIAAATAQQERRSA